jgi:hypothetical protein
VQREARLFGFEPALGAELVGGGEELWVHVREVGRDADGRLGGGGLCCQSDAHQGGLIDGCTHSWRENEFAVLQRVVGGDARCAEKNAVRGAEGFADDCILWHT